MVKPRHPQLNFSGAECLILNGLLEGICCSIILACIILGIADIFKSSKNVQSFVAYSLNIIFY